MDEGTVGRLRIAASVLALVVAAIHLLHPSQGGHALLTYARVGYLGDPRPLLFTLGGFALVFGVVAGYNGVGGRLLYLGGIAIALAVPTTLALAAAWRIGWWFSDGYRGTADLDAHATTPRLGAFGSSYGTEGSFRSLALRRAGSREGSTTSPRQNAFMAGRVARNR
jgi:hypothetical protein